MIQGLGPGFGVLVSPAILHVPKNSGHPNKRAPSNMRIQAVAVEFTTCAASAGRLEEHKEAVAKVQASREGREMTPDGNSQAVQNNMHCSKIS